MRLIAPESDEHGLRFAVLVGPDNDVPDGPIYAVESTHATWHAAEAALHGKPPILPAGLPLLPVTAAPAAAAAP